jgi:hypothetical protein
MVSVVFDLPISSIKSYTLSIRVTSFIIFQSLIVFFLISFQSLIVKIRMYKSGVSSPYTTIVISLKFEYINP